MITVELGKYSQELKKLKHRTREIFEHGFVLSPQSNRHSKCISLVWYLWYSLLSWGKPWLRCFVAFDVMQLNWVILDKTRTWRHTSLKICVQEASPSGKLKNNIWPNSLVKLIFYAHLISLPSDYRQPWILFYPRTSCEDKRQNSSQSVMISLNNVELHKIKRHS